MRERFWIEAGLAVASNFLLLLTLVNSEWIEASFRVDPDGGSGSLEWLIVAALLATTVAFGLLARAERLATHRLVRRKSVTRPGVRLPRLARARAMRRAVRRSRAPLRVTPRFP